MDFIKRQMGYKLPGDLEKGSQEAFAEYKQQYLSFLQNAGRFLEMQFNEFSALNTVTVDDLQKFAEIDMKYKNEIRKVISEVDGLEKNLRKFSSNVELFENGIAEPNPDVNLSVLVARVKRGKNPATAPRAAEIPTRAPESYSYAQNPPTSVGKKNEPTPFTRMSQNREKNYPVLPLQSDQTRQYQQQQGHNIQTRQYQQTQGHNAQTQQYQQQPQYFQQPQQQYQQQMSQQQYQQYQQPYGFNQF
jgi:hypothetical protein